jgi:hypothetical protein
VIYALASIGSEWDVAIAGAALRKVSDPGIAVAAMVLLRSVPDGQALASERAELVRAAAHEFARRHPDTMQFALIAALVGAARDAPFSAAELDEIERVSRLPTVRTDHFSQVYDRALRVYQASGLPNAEGFAFGAAVGSIATGSDVFLLTKRAEASIPHTSESDKRRLANALWRIGAAIKDMPTILERLLGTMAMKKGAELVGDAKRAAEADQIAAHGRAVLTEFHKLNAGGWPIPSLQAEMLAAAVENEFAAMQEAVEPIPIPQEKPQ